MKKNIIRLLLVAIITLIAGHGLLSEAYSARTEHGTIATEVYYKKRASRISRNVTQVSYTENSDVQTAIEQVSPAVVSIYGYKTVPIQEQAYQIIVPFFGTISLTIPAAQEGLARVDAGTGFFIDSDGYLLTANHVVADKEAAYQVVLADGTAADATVLYRNPETDVALLKIEGSDFPSLRLGDSSSLRHGQIVAGLGNAFGHSIQVPSAGQVVPMEPGVTMLSDAVTPVPPTNYALELV
jgi:serine protease Do